MGKTTNRLGQESAGNETARQPMYAVAAKLHDFGFGIRLPKDGVSRRLVIVNAKRARSSITIDDDGYVTWDYQPWSEAVTDPVDLAGVALSLLGPAGTGMRPTASRGLTLKASVGRVLRNLGLNVTMAVYEDVDALDVASEVVATNPAVPFCGLVRVGDDARITWECRITGPVSECALAVSDTIVPLLSHGTEGMCQILPRAATPMPQDL